jgi:apolipoprotein N-acyltransferase
MTSSAANLKAADQTLPTRNPRWKALAIRALAMLLTAALVTLAMAPLGQFYLAWIALVPWLWVVCSTRRTRGAFGWGFFGGLIVFSIHLESYFRLMIAIPIAMVLILAAIWGVLAIIARRCSTKPLMGSLLFAAAWVGLEFFRGRLVFEYPVYYLGHSQSPFPAITQIADLFGVYGISFLVAGVNACVAFSLFTTKSGTERFKLLSCWSVLVLLALAYGLVRLHEPLQLGPRVMVVQSTLDFGPGGAASLDREAHLNLLLKETTTALEKEKDVDLVIWPESVTPPINPEARRELREGQAGPQLERMHAELSELTAKHHTGLILGGYYIGDWQLVNGQRMGMDIRNSAYLYDRDGEQVARYDKIHLVPYGEYIPLRESAPWFGGLLARIGPWRMDYVLNPGLVTATLPQLSGDPPLRLLPTICFEDNIAPQLATMARRHDEKAADLIANMSNDGWFSSWYMAQRAQAASFRCIENRLPMARAESGGVSGLFDSCGRKLVLLPAWKTSYAVEKLPLDSRTTLYQRIGDAFPFGCLLVTIAAIVWPLRPKPTESPGAD